MGLQFARQLSKAVKMQVETSGDWKHRGGPWHVSPVGSLDDLRRLRTLRE
jgi:hypothetical protein